MSQAIVKPFENEKTNVLGELAIRLKKSSISDDEPGGSYPPNPPVFQTWARRLSGDTTGHEVTSAPRVSQTHIQAPSPVSPPKQFANSSPPGLISLSGPVAPPPSSQLTLPSRYVHKKCVGCQEAVITGGGYANGHLYHQQCFKCYNCQVQLEDKFSSAQGKLLCNICFKLYEKICSVCNKSILKDCVESNGQFYHNKCMKCSECKTILDGAYFILSGSFLCEKDYNRKKKKCHDCGQLIDGKYYTDNNNKTICEADYKRKLGKCKRCNECLEGSLLKIPGASFHADCFRCKICNVSLVNTDVMTDDNRDVYCTKDYDQLFADKCFKCKAPIVPVNGATAAPRLRALDRDYHPACFTCEKCGLMLEDGCYPIKKKPYCFDCYDYLR